MSPFHGRRRENSSDTCRRRAYSKRTGARHTCIDDVKSPRSLRVPPFWEVSGQKSNLASWRKTVRFCVKRSLFFASRLFWTSAMRRSKAAVSFICRSGDEACDGAGIVSAVSQRASAREKAGRAEGVSHVRSATVVSAILQTGKCSKECMSYALYNMKRHVHTCCWIIDCFHEAKKLGLERIKARSGRESDH